MAIESDGNCAYQQQARLEGVNPFVTKARHHLPTS
jgi:hypothetical protein